MSAATYLLGDVVEVMATMPDNSVDLVLTSPPFLALRSYLPAGHNRPLSARRKPKPTIGGIWQPPPGPNFGDHLTPVRCVKCEWSGQKQDIPRREGFGVPLCPNGHALLETGPLLRLGLIEEER